MIDEPAQAAAGVLMIRSEQSEIVHVRDRAYGMRAGRIAGELARADPTPGSIIRPGMHG